LRKLVIVGYDAQLALQEEHSAHCRLKEWEQNEKEEQRKARENQAVSRISD
jgi:hypothetical protein